MATMKISEITFPNDSDTNIDYTNADFSFPDNPRNIDDDMSTGKQAKVFPQSHLHTMWDVGGVQPKNLLWQGMMRGASRHTNIQSLSKYIFNPKMLAFFIDSTRFYVCFGNNMKTILQGNKYRIVDYMASFTCTFPMILSTTRRTQVNAEATANGVAETLTGFVNSGTAPSYVYWEITANGGAVTKVEIGNGAISGGAVGGAIKLKWEGTLADTKTLKIFAYKKNANNMYRAGIVENDGTEERGLEIIGARFMPYIDVEATNQSFSVEITGANAVVSAFSRDSYWK